MVEKQRPNLLGRASDELDCDDKGLQWSGSSMEKQQDPILNLSEL